MAFTTISRRGIALIFFAGSLVAACNDDGKPDESETNETSFAGADSGEPESCAAACVGNTECFRGTLAFPDPECDACVRERCCADLQGCFGDETFSSAPPCAEHYACLYGGDAVCDAASYEEYYECQAQMEGRCRDNAEQQNAAEALRMCALDCGCA